MASTSFPSSEYTLFSPSAAMDPSPLITMPVADLFLGNPIRNRCLVPFPEDDHGASTRFTPKKRHKRKTSLAMSMLQGFSTSANVVMHASSGDDMDCDDSGSEEEANEEMEVSGWMVLSPSKRSLKRPITPVPAGSRPFLTAERLKSQSDEEANDDEQLAEEDEILERIKRSRIDKGKGRAIEKGPTIHPHERNRDGESTKVQPLRPSTTPNRNEAGQRSNRVRRTSSVSEMNVEAIALDKSNDRIKIVVAPAIPTGTSSSLKPPLAASEDIVNVDTFASKATITTDENLDRDGILARKRKCPCSPTSTNPKRHAAAYHR